MFKNDYGYVIDIETLGTSADSVIVSFAAACFHLCGEEKYEDIVANVFTQKLDIKSQIEAGRKVNPDTKQWWRDQIKEHPELANQIIPSSHDVHPQKAFRRLWGWLKMKGIDENSLMWSRGPSFDIPILTSLASLWGNHDCFISRFDKQRDTRTFIATMTGDMAVSKLHGISKPDSFVPHNPVHDVAFDVYQLQQLVKVFQSE